MPINSTFAPRAMISDTYSLTNDNWVLAVVRDQKNPKKAFFFMEALIDDERKFFQSSAFRLETNLQRRTADGSTLTLTVGEQGSELRSKIDSDGARESHSNAEYVYQSWNINSFEGINLLAHLADLQPNHRETIQSILTKTLKDHEAQRPWEKFDHKLLQLSDLNTSSNSNKSLYFKLALVVGLGLASFAVLFFVPSVSLLLAAGIASAVVALAGLLYAACKLIAYACSKRDNDEQATPMPAIVHNPSVLLQDYIKAQGKPSPVLEETMDSEIDPKPIVGADLGPKMAEDVQRPGMLRFSYTRR